MKKYFPLIFLLYLSLQGYGQNYQSKYAVFDKKMVLVKGVKETSELVCVVPKGNPVQIMEKVRGPIYKAQYKNWRGYIISFNLEKRLTKSKSLRKNENIVRTSSKRHYITLSRRTYITKKSNYKMVISVPKRETLEVLERVKKGKYLVRYKNHMGYTELGSFNVQNEVSQALLATMKINKSSREKNFVERFPPVITIDDIGFSKPVLAAGGSTKLEITLSNAGYGDANQVFVRLSSQNSAVEYPLIRRFPIIRADGGVASIKIDILGKPTLTSGVSTLQIEIVDEEYKGSILQRQVRFETEELPKPQLVIPRYAIHEVDLANANHKINLNEAVDLSFTIRNDGKANAQFLNISVESEQQGVIPLGLVNNNVIQRLNTQVKTIDPGGYYNFTYRYFINSEFLDQNLKFKICGKDQYHGIDFSADLIFPVSQTLDARDWQSRQVVNGEIYQRNKTNTLENKLLFDVDIDIPITRQVQKQTYALIIGNEDYTMRQKSLSTEQNAKYAINDAKIFKDYCQKTLGIPENHIKLLKNATAAEMGQGLAWINHLAKIEHGNAKLIFYYSGHGLPDEETKSPILIPVDVSANNLGYGIHLSEAYEKLVEHPSLQVSVFLDACFSGGGRNQGLITKKGIKVKANKNVIHGNMVVFSSSSEKESSSIFEETRHGYFTYYLLKKLKETRGNVQFEELSNYLINSVQKETALKGIVQTPELKFSQKVADDWKKWQLK